MEHKLRVEENLLASCRWSQVPALRLRWKLSSFIVKHFKCLIHIEGRHKKYNPTNMFPGKQRKLNYVDFTSDLMVFASTQLGQCMEDQLCGFCANPPTCMYIFIDSLFFSFFFNNFKAVDLIGRAAAFADCQRERQLR